MKVSEKKLAEAEAILAKAASQPSNSPAPLLALGRLYLLQRRLPEAAAQFEAARQRAPNDGEAMLDLAKTQLAQGHKDRAEAIFLELSRLPDEKYRLYHAVFLFQNGFQARAIEEMKAAVKADPKDRNARTALVSAYLSLNRVADAEAILGAALDRNPKDVEARLQHAQILIASGRHGEAEADLAVVLKYQPDMGEAHYLLAKAQGARGARLHQRQELDKALKFNPRLLAGRMELARELTAAGSAQAALDLMNRAPADQAGRLPAIVERNWALVALGDYAEAAKGVEAGFAAAGRVPELLLQDAAIKLAAGRYAAARASLEEGLERSPEDSRLLEALARSYNMEQNPRGALERLRRHAERYPGSALVQKTLGDWLLRANDKPRARAAYLAALSADPKKRPARCWRWRRSMRARATWTWRGEGLPPSPIRSRPTSPLCSNSATWRRARATAPRPCCTTARCSKPIPATPAPSTISPGCWRSLPTRSTRRLKYAEAAGEADPDNPAVQDTLGWVYYRKGLYANAVRHLERAAPGGKAAAHYHLGLAYAKVGDFARAEKALRSGSARESGKPRGGRGAGNPEERQIRSAVAVMVRTAWRADAKSSVLFIFPRCPLFDLRPRRRRL